MPTRILSCSRLLFEDIYTGFTVIATNHLAHGGKKMKKLNTELKYQPNNDQRLCAKIDSYILELR